MSDSIIVSADGLLSVKATDVTNVCLTPSSYALLQYLLLFDNTMVAERTCYFLGYGVPRSISGHLPAVHISTLLSAKRWSPRRWIDKLQLRFVYPRRYPFLRTAKLYAFDQGFVGPLIGRHEYSLLSDAPLCMTQNMQLESAEYQRQKRKHTSFSGRLEQLLFGQVATHTMGNNPQCIQFFMTEPNESPVFGSRPVHVQSLKSLWEQSSEEKRSLVRRVFDVSDEDLALVSSRRVMFLTQPLIQDCGLTEEEYLEILHRVFSHYDHSQLLLKLHPRDCFDYCRHFPQVAVFDKSVNMQLLVLLGTSVERAVTVCSSSVGSFPESVPVDWFGPEIHPKLRAFFGSTMRPDRPYNQMQV